MLLDEMGEMEETENRQSSKNGISSIDFKIGTFLESNYKLFTVLSVFGAISVYLPQLGNLEENKILKTGFVSALFLVFLTSFAINRRFFSEIKGVEGLLKSLLHPSMDTYAIVAFLIPFNSLSIALIGVSGSYTATLAFLFQFIGTLIGIAVTFHIIKIIDERRDTPETEANTLTLIATTIILVFIIMGLDSVLITRIEAISNFELEKMFTFTSEFGLIPVLNSFLLGVYLAGGIYWILASILTISGIFGLLRKSYFRIQSLVF